MNVFKQFFQCFYALRKTAVYRFQSIGKTILYVFTMMLIISLPTAIMIYLDVDDLFENAASQFNENMPEFELKNGQLTSVTDEPVTWTNNGYIYYFDPTGEITTEQVTKHENAVGFLQSELVLKRSQQQQTLPYEGLFLPENLTKEKAIDLIKKLEQWLLIIGPLFFLIMYLFATALKFIGISALALAGLLFKNAMKRRVNYSQLWRLSAYAATIPTTIFALLDAFQITVPGAFLLYWLVAFLCIITILKGVPKPKS
ncbi:DUF1189 domain-containing protein [Bacillus tianshenii]|nr:DUF1189 domain-containing protein [Bacillus tianshenii]